MVEALEAQKRLGAKCEKVPNIISYSCSFSNEILANKLVAIELHKNKDDCKIVPKKTAKQMKFLMK